MKPNHIRILSLLAAILFALPLLLGLFTGLYLWLSPYLFFNSVLATRTLSALNLLGLTALLVTLFKTRWFCRYVCPTGVLCDAVSKIGSKRKLLHQIPPLGKPLFVIASVSALFSVPVFMLLDPIALLYAFMDGFRSPSMPIQLLKFSGLILILLLNLIVPNIWCQRLCPLGGLQDWATEARAAFTKWTHAPNTRFIPNRRILLTGMIGIGCGLIVRTLAKAQSILRIRPPGSLPEPQFKTTCVRCGNCAKACPAGIIQASLDTGDPAAALTPHIRFNDSYCLPECSNCGDVCPSGAIEKFSPDIKNQLVIGIARIDLPDCLLLNNRECDRCKASCAYNAIEIKPSEDGFYSIPSIIENKCIGCGACKIICPAEIIGIVPIGSVINTPPTSA